MIEIADNIVQLISTGLVTVISLYRSARTKSLAWNMLGLFSGVYFLGLTYWLLFLLFYNHTPHYSIIQDLSWYSSYLFLMLLIIYVREESSGNDSFPVSPRTPIGEIVASIKPVLWLIPVFTDGSTVFEQASAVFVCKKLYAQDMKKECFIDRSCDDQWCPNGDYHTEYIGEIVAGYVKK